MIKEKNCKTPELEALFALTPSEWKDLPEAKKKSFRKLLETPLQSSRTDTKSRLLQKKFAYHQKRLLAFMKSEPSEELSISEMQIIRQMKPIPINWENMSSESNKKCEQLFQKKLHLVEAQKFVFLRVGSKTTEIDFQKRTDMSE